MYIFVNVKLELMSGADHLALNNICIRVFLNECKFSESLQNPQIV